MYEVQKLMAILPRRKNDLITFINKAIDDNKKAIEKVVKERNQFLKTIEDDKIVEKYNKENSLFGMFRWGVVNHISIMNGEIIYSGAKMKNGCHSSENAFLYHLKEKYKINLSDRDRMEKLYFNIDAFNLTVNSAERWLEALSSETIAEKDIPPEYLKLFFGDYEYVRSTLMKRRDVYISDLCRS